MKLPRKIKKRLKNNTGVWVDYKGHHIQYTNDGIWLRMALWKDPTVSLVDKLKPVESYRFEMLDFSK